MNLLDSCDYIIAKPYNIEGDSFYGNFISSDVTIGTRISTGEIVLYLSENIKTFTIKGESYMAFPSKDLIAIVEE